MKSAAQKLYDTGLEAFDSVLQSNYRDRAFLAAVANMLAEATAPKPAKKRKSGRTLEDKITGHNLYELLRKECPGTLAYEPVNVNTFSVVGKKLREAHATNEDIGMLVLWFHTLPFAWRDSPPTWGELVRKIVDWLALAKAHHVKDSTRKSLLSDLREEEEL